MVGFSSAGSEADGLGAAIAAWTDRDLVASDRAIDLDDGAAALQTRADVLALGGAAGVSHRCWSSGMACAFHHTSSSTSAAQCPG